VQTKNRNNQEIFFILPQLKNAAVILLCAILLFNWIGYRLVINYMESAADHSLEASLDADHYDESQLISIKVPAAHLSFYTHEGSFERATGTIAVAGLTYKFVKKRYCGDSLEFMCLADQGAMKFQSARTELFKIFNDLQSSQNKKTNHHSESYKVFPAEYENSQSAFSYHVLKPGASAFSNVHARFLPPVFHLAVEQPPEPFI